MENEDQRQYELTLILSPELEEKAIDSFGQEFEKKIKDLGGILKKRGKSEKRNLAYPIKKFQFGHYLVISFLFNPEKLEKLSMSFKHEENVLRHVINFIEEPSAIKAGEKKKRRQPKAGPPRAEKMEKIKEIAEEVTEEEVEYIKKKIKKSPLKPRVEKKKEAKLEDIDKKLDEILGI